MVVVVQALWNGVSSHPIDHLRDLLQSIDYLLRECGDTSANNQQKGVVNFYCFKTGLHYLIRRFGGPSLAETISNLRHALHNHSSGAEPRQRVALANVGTIREQDIRFTVVASILGRIKQGHDAFEIFANELFARVGKDEVVVDDLKKEPAFTDKILFEELRRGRTVLKLLLGQSIFGARTEISTSNLLFRKLSPDIKSNLELFGWLLFDSRIIDSVFHVLGTTFRNGRHW
jgi:hypothetical protein